jgi:hypothetical protein
MIESFLKIALMVLVLSVGCRSASGGCPKFLAGHKVGTIQLAKIGGASGLAASRKNPGVLWTHNDYGPACVYAMTAEGKHLGVYNLEGAKNRNWEDIAIGPGPEPNVDYLYVGEIGDNDSRCKSIKIYRVPEPKVDANQAPANVTLANVETIELVYPDGPRDAETLMVDPLTKDIYIISKEGTSKVYRAAYPQSSFAISDTKSVKDRQATEDRGNTGKTTLEQVAKLHWGMATAGDISPDGCEIIVRGYFAASLLLRPKDGPIWKAFENSECSIPIILEQQGESICFDANGAGYYTTSEHKHQPIYYFPRDTKSKN